jgi:WhiB family redox-sensing transcriptional regulator
MKTKSAPARPGRIRPRQLGWIAALDPLWRQKARCAGYDTEVFFPEDTQPTLVAKSLCRRCPVKIDCLVHALQQGERYGIWGGLTAHERDLLTARLARRDTPAQPVPGDDDGPVAA